MRTPLAPNYAGMVKALARLSPEDREPIKAEVILVPDDNGPVLVPAGNLVYDNAPWLTSRLRNPNLRLVHREVGDEVRLLHLRSTFVMQVSAFFSLLEF